MKKTTRTIETKTVTTENTDTFCDRCGVDVYETRRGDDVDSVTIEHEIGQAWNSSDYCIDKCEIDCCGTCFKEHVIPALKAAGFNVPEYKDVP